MNEDWILSVHGIEKSFPGVKALDDVTFTLKKGEVHALIGENGAGKSTLMKVLGGVYTQDAGEIRINGETVEIKNSFASLKLGIGIVYQEINLVPTMSAAENIFLGEEITKRNSPFLNKNDMCIDAQEILDTLSVNHFSAKSLIRNLSIAQRQLVEIAKALKIGAKILVFDEPTAVLSQFETDILFDIIRKLREDGVSIIYISHRLEEIFKVCDRVTVLRDGKIVGTNNVAEVEKADLIKMMVGRELGHSFSSGNANYRIEDVALLDVRGLSRGKEFQDVYFTLHKGEILGFSGLVGAGRSELMKAIIGFTSPDSGEIIINGENARIRNVKDAIAYGFGLVPEDRKGEGLILNETLTENITITAWKYWSKNGFVKKLKRRELAEEYIEKLSIRPPIADRLSKSFSGGNQQKIVVGKWLISNPRILILDEPTRGVDVGAKEEIYTLIRELTEMDVSVIIVSSEIEEILGLCNRVIVMCEGRITAEMPISEATQEKIMYHSCTLLSA